jgi:hypothetical protein
MDSANRSVADVELEGYFVAALAFIDPQLPADAPLDAIEAAAVLRRQSLASLPAPIAEADQAQLSEALDFVRRSYERLPHEQPQLAEIALDPAETDSAAEAELNGHAVFEVSDLEATPVHTNGNGHHTGGNGHAAHVASESAQESELFQPRRRSPLSRLWDEAEKNEERADALPEARALPVAQGLLLLGYEVWLALFAGWVATRFWVWPRPGNGYEVSPLGGHGLVLLAIATAGVAAWLIWRYRTLFHRTAALVHAGAVLLTLDLLLWRRAAGPDNFPRIDGPGYGLWEALAVGWIVAAVYAHISDLRAR